MPPAWYLTNLDNSAPDARYLRYSLHLRKTPCEAQWDCLDSNRNYLHNNTFIMIVYRYDFHLQKYTKVRKKHLLTLNINAKCYDV